MHKSVQIFWINRRKKDEILTNLIERTILGNEEESKSENILEGEKSRKLYQIEILPKFKCDFIIIFRPKYVGLHHEILDINFLSGNKMIGRKVRQYE